MCVCVWQGGLSETLADVTVLRAFTKDLIICSSIAARSSVFTSAGVEVRDVVVEIDCVDVATVVALAGVPCNANRAASWILSRRYGSSGK